MKRFILGALALLAASLLSGPALAQGNSCSGGGIVGMVVGGTQVGAACYYLKVNSDGSISVSGSLTPSGTQDVNEVQVGGVTLLRGAGATGTGSPRETVAQDATTIAGAAPGTAGSASANVVTIQGIVGGTAIPTSTTPTQRTIVTLDVATVTTGGTAVTALIAGHKTAGGFLYNPMNATINLCVNEQGTASGTTSSNATTCIPPGGTYNLAPSSGAVSVITSDSAHPFSGYGLN